MTSAVAVADDLGNGELLELTYSLRGLTPADVRFFTAPVLDTGTEGSASVVHLNENTGLRTWRCLQTAPSASAAEFSPEALPETPH